MARKIVFVRLNEEDIKLLQELAKFYDISEADVMRIALKEFARNHGFDKKEEKKES